MGEGVSPSLSRDGFHVANHLVVSDSGSCEHVIFVFPSWKHGRVPLGLPQKVKVGHGYSLRGLDRANVVPPKKVAYCALKGANNIFVVAVADADDVPPKRAVYSASEGANTSIDVTDAVTGSDAVAVDADVVADEYSSTDALPSDLQYSEPPCSDSVRSEMGVLETGSVRRTGHSGASLSGAHASKIDISADGLQAVHAVAGGVGTYIGQITYYDASSPDLQGNVPRRLLSSPDPGVSLLPGFAIPNSWVSDRNFHSVTTPTPSTGSKLLLTESDSNYPDPCEGSHGRVSVSVIEKTPIWTSSKFMGFRIDLLVGSIQLGVQGSELNSGAIGASLKTRAAGGHESRLCLQREAGVRKESGPKAGVSGMLKLGAELHGPDPVEDTGKGVNGVRLFGSHKRDKTPAPEFSPANAGYVFVGPWVRHVGQLTEFRLEELSLVFPWLKFYVLECTHGTDGCCLAEHQWQAAVVGWV